MVKNEGLWGTTAGLANFLTPHNANSPSPFTFHPSPLAIHYSPLALSQAPAQV